MLLVQIKTIIICNVVSQWDIFMFVCVCHGITDKQIKEAVENGGVGNMRELKQALNVGTQCGSCIETAQSIIDTTIIDENLFKEVV